MQHKAKVWVSCFFSICAPVPGSTAQRRFSSYLTHHRSDFINVWAPKLQESSLRPPLFLGTGQSFTCVSDYSTPAKPDFSGAKVYGAIDDDSTDRVDCFFLAAYRPTR